MPAEKERLPGSIWLRRAGCRAGASRRRATILARLEIGVRQEDGELVAADAEGTDPPAAAPPLHQRAEVAAQRPVADGVARVSLIDLKSSRSISTSATGTS